MLRGPNAERGEPSNWTLPDLCRFIETCFSKTMCLQSMSRLVRRLGLSRQKARPVHPLRSAKAAKAFIKGALPRPSRRLVQLIRTAGSSCGFRTVRPWAIDPVNRSQAGTALGRRGESANAGGCVASVRPPLRQALRLGLPLGYTCASSLSHRILANLDADRDACGPPETRSPPIQTAFDLSSRTST
ncbi:helix-turn-helix domain-containing protein [Aureimonas sp. Leaf427]|uniref:helix-turn-helix domain-containing protein n=1 Tax=Aureimonas sp. Leaf427 TaxID=1736375 RepID=UPI0039B74FE9